MPWLRHPALVGLSVGMSLCLLFLLGFSVGLYVLPSSSWSQETNPPGPTVDAKVVLEVHEAYRALTQDTPALVQRSEPPLTDASQQLAVLVDQLKVWAQQFFTEKNRADQQQGNTSALIVQNNKLQQQVQQLKGTVTALEAKVKAAEGKGTEATKPKAEGEGK
jgi:hypothetical protein